MSAPQGANNLRVIISALSGNLAIAVSKFVAAYVTGSAGTLAEAVHSLADTGNQVLLLLGMRLSERTPTEQHPFGRAAEKYFWPFVVSILLFSVGGAFAVYEGVEKLLEVQHGVVRTGSNLWSYVVLGLSAAFETYSFIVALGEFKKLRGSRSAFQTMRMAKDPTVPVVVLEDLAALVGLFVALIGLLMSDLTGWQGWDGIASLVIGVLLCFVALFLGRETHSLLVGESASQEDRQTARTLIEGVEGVDGITQLLTMHLGPQEVLLAVKIAFPRGMPVERVEAVIEDLETKVRSALPHMRYIFVEPDAHYQAHRDERAVVQ
jgi:cation diffusion facilitator family transporter